MLVKPIVCFLCVFICLVSIIILIYAKKNERKNVCKNIIILSTLYMIFLFLEMSILPNYLDLDFGFEVIQYLLCFYSAIILFIVAIIISKKKLKSLEVIEKTKKDKIFLLVLIILPVIIFSFAYFKEKYYINNSELILVYSGTDINSNAYAYAINDNYCEEVSIGTELSGLNMERHLPKGFNELNYTWVTDKVEVYDNKIIIYRNDEVVYEGKLNNEMLSDYNLREIFYKQKK